MNLPRLRTSRSASSNSIAPAQTSAEYSPRLWPATKSGSTPLARSTARVATDVARMAAWVFSVCRSASAGPSKQSCERGKPQRLIGPFEHGAGFGVS